MAALDEGGWVLVEPAPMQPLDDLSWGIVVDEELPQLDLEDEWDSYHLSLSLRVGPVLFKKWSRAYQAASRTYS